MYYGFLGCMAECGIMVYIMVQMYICIYLAETVHVHVVLKARHLSDSAFCTGFSRLGVPEQALDGIPLGVVSLV